MELCEIETIAPHFPVLYCDIPFILNITVHPYVQREIDTRRSCASLRPRHTVHPEHKKKRFGLSSLIPRTALRICRHPPNASLLLKVQHILVFSQFPLLTKLWSSLPVSPLDEYTIANFGYIRKCLFTNMSKFFFG